MRKIAWVKIRKKFGPRNYITNFRKDDMRYDQAASISFYCCCNFKLIIWENWVSPKLILTNNLATSLKKLKLSGSLNYGSLEKISVLKV